MKSSIRNALLGTVVIIFCFASLHSFANQETPWLSSPPIQPDHSWSAQGISADSSAQGTAGSIEKQADARVGPKDNWRQNGGKDKKDVLALDWKFKARVKEDWKEDKMVLQPSQFRNDTLFNVSGDVVCYARGSKSEASLKAKSCVCHANYFGSSCGIPDSVWFSSIRREDRDKLSLRAKPRRIVQTLIVNHEFDFFEARLRDHWDTVDVFLILEAKFTAFGDKKDSKFFDKLKTGWLAEFQHKILYVYLDFFHEKGRHDGWFADSYPRVYLGEQGLARIEGLEDDDIIVYNDADEIPNRSTLEFLKYFEGYSEPITFVYRWTIFGYYWLSVDKSNNEKLTEVVSAGTWRLVNRGLGNNVWALRNKKLRGTYSSRIHQSNITLAPWRLGAQGHYAGYHCSWCFSTEDIQTKLLSAQSDDGPRWGDFPEKVDAGFIDSIRESGSWFDLVGTFKKIEYAPSYIMENYEKFKNILVAPSST